jgi:REP element-mobilizing transposase RayT
MTYLITFSCYGCHLHGDEAGSVDPDHNIVGSRVIDANPKRTGWVRSRMDQAPYSMDRDRRQEVLSSLVERCLYRRWGLLAAHVRTNHVHLVIEAEVRPERIMNDLKSFASRRLNQLGFDGTDRRRWARHGSTRWLWKREAILAAVCYVVDKQGDQMAVFRAATTGSDLL